MTKKVLSIVFLLLTVVFLFTSCSPKGSDAQIVMPIDKQPEYLDPQIVSDSGAKTIIANCFEGLVEYNAEGQIVPAACESYEVSDDGLTYTFYLRTDGRWRVPSLAKETVVKYYKNNKDYDFSKDFDVRVTADDFIFALRRALQPETKCPYAQNLLNIKNADKVNRGKLRSSALGVEKDGDYVLKIHLERADCDFLYALTLPCAMPCHEEFFKITKGHYGLYTSYLIFNGPFYISGWSEKTAITARRNEYYKATKEEIEKNDASSAGEVKPRSLYFSFNNEQGTRDKKIKDGTYQIAPLTESQVEPFLKSNKYSVNAVKSAVTSVVFNCKDELLQNEKLRKAIAYTLDSDGLCELLNEEKAKGIIPSASIVGTKKYRDESTVLLNKATTEKAVKLFKEALKELNKSDAEIVILCETENETAVRSIMQKWQSVFGAAFSVSVNAVERSALLSSVNSLNYQIALLDVTYTDTTALSALSRYKSDSRTNISGYSSKTYDKLISKAGSERSEKGKIKALLKAETYLLESCAVVPIAEKQVYYVSGKGVSNIIFSPTGEVQYFKNTLAE